jgi:hypothetical protein
MPDSMQMHYGITVITYLTWLVCRSVYIFLWVNCDCDGRAVAVISGFIWGKIYTGVC